MLVSEATIENIILKYRNRKKGKYSIDVYSINVLHEILSDFFIQKSILIILIILFLLFVLRQQYE